MRVVPRECEEINETWIADRDRFSYEGLYSDDRLLNPQLRHSDGSWREVEWDQALEAAVNALKGAAAGPDGLGLLAHPSSTLEELYLLARLADGLGSAHIDHRLRQRDFRDQAADARAPGLGLAIAAIDQLDALLVVGSNLRHEVPILAHRVRKASLRGAKIHFINPARFEYLFPVARYLVTPNAGEVTALAAVLLAALGDAPAPAAMATLLAGVAVADEHRAIAEALKNGARRAIWLGALSVRSGRYSELRALARALAAATGASFGELAEGGNAAGAYLAGVLPHRGAAGAARASSGWDARAMLEQTLSGYLLLHCEPWADAALPGALETLAKSRGVVAVTPYASDEMKRIAQVLLPAGAFAESSGTYVNLEGRWQSQAGAVKPLGAARPAWKILRVLGNLLNLPAFDYQSSEQIRDELKAQIDAAQPSPEPSTGAPWAASRAEPVIDLAMYQIDPVLRRSGSLARTADGRAASQVYAGAAT
jgi:NADH-quinone oxidoreductase subunit G